MRTTQGCPTLRLIGSPGARTSGSRRPALRFSRSLVRVTTTRRSQSPPTRMGAFGTRSTFSTSVQERSLHHVAYFAAALEAPEWRAPWGGPFLSVSLGYPPKYVWPPCLEAFPTWFVAPLPGPCCGG